MVKRDRPLADVPAMLYGSKPVDGGNFLFTDEEKSEFLEKEPKAAKYIRPFLGADELLYGFKRWCLWLKNITPEELRAMPQIRKRVDAVVEFRRNSKKRATVEMANYPTLFAEDRQPKSEYLALPEVSGEKRQYLPVSILSPTVIASNKLYKVEKADLYVVSILSSKMHFCWMAQTSGRLESRFQYSSSLTYNTFPWPRDLSDKQQESIESCGQGVLNARKQFPNASLADLYDPLSMPPALREAHTALDRAVDAAYGKKDFKSDAERVAFLFDLYQKYTTLLPAAEKPKRARSRKAH